MMSFSIGIRENSPQTRQRQQRTQRLVPPCRRRPLDAPQNPAHGAPRVLMPEQHRNHIVRQSFAVEQRLCIEFADVDHAAIKAKLRKTAFHAERRFAGIKHNLLGPAAEAPVDGQGIFRHAQDHLVGVRTLEFDMDQPSVHRFAQQIDARAVHPGQFHIEPAGHLGTRQLPRNRRRRIHQRFFQGGVVFMHLLNMRKLWPPNRGLDVWPASAV
jgi:hypothetical protein